LPPVPSRRGLREFPLEQAPSEAAALLSSACNASSSRLSTGRSWSEGGYRRGKGKDGIKPDIQALWQELAKIQQGDPDQPAASFFEYSFEVLTIRRSDEPHEVPPRQNL